MESCNFIDFMNVFKPWLNADYIRKAGMDDNGNFRLQLFENQFKLGYDQIVRQSIQYSASP